MLPVDTNKRSMNFAVLTDSDREHVPMKTFTSTSNHIMSIKASFTVGLLLLFAFHKSTNSQFHLFFSVDGHFWKVKSRICLFSVNFIALINFDISQ